MPNTTRPYLILANIKTALEAITSPTAPQAVYLDDSQARDIAEEAGPFYIVVPGVETLANTLIRSTVTLLEFTWEVHVAAMCKGRVVATTATYGADLASEMRQAIIAALLADRTRGGYALNTKQTKSGFYPEEYQDWDASVGVTFEIQYRHRDNDSRSG